MNYNLKFIPAALSEWKKLDNGIQDRFKKKLKDCISDPRIPENNLSGFENHYKIRLRASNYSLIYEVGNGDLYVLGVAAVKPEEDLVFKKT